MIEIEVLIFFSITINGQLTSNAYMWSTFFIVFSERVPKH